MYSMKSYPETIVLEATSRIFSDLLIRIFRRIRSRIIRRTQILISRHILILISWCCTRACGLGSQCGPNECLFGSGKPRGVGISGKGPHGLGEGNGELVYEQPGNKVDGSCHSKEGSK